MLKRFALRNVLITAMSAMVFSALPASHAFADETSPEPTPAPAAPGKASIIDGQTYDDTLVFTVRVKNATPKSSIIVRLSTCSGKWTYKRVKSKGGKFTFKVRADMGKLPNHLQSRVELRSPGYTSKVEEFGWDLEGMAKC